MIRRPPSSTRSHTLCPDTAGFRSAMLPLKTTVIALVRVNSNDDKVYRIEPLTQRTDGFDLVVESAAKQYVRDLLEIDPITQEMRRRTVMRKIGRAHV